MVKWAIRVLIGAAVLVVGFAAFVLWWGMSCHLSDDPTRYAQTGARIVRTAVQQWQAANNATTCPTIAQLIQERQLDPGQTVNDPWNQPYELSCDADEVTVRSSGPDRKWATADDVVVPRQVTAGAR
jgi:nitrogen fixation-related uncharacterized protein